MSLIQEALKRKLEEQQGLPPAPPPTSGALPGPSRGRGPSKGGAFGRILGFFFALLLLLSVAVALFYLAAKNWNWRDAMAEAKSDAGQARGRWEHKMGAMRQAKEAERARVDAAPAEAESSPQPYAGVQQRVANMKEKVIAYEAEHAPVVEGTEAPATPAGAASAAPAETVKEEGERGGVMGFFKRGEEGKKGGAWPKITVNGILAGGRQGGGAALINNRMVSANEQVEGARVVEVQAKGVLMEYKGETRLLLIGQTSE